MNRVLRIQETMDAIQETVEAASADMLRATEGTEPSVSEDTEQPASEAPEKAANEAAPETNEAVETSDEALIEVVSETAEVIELAPAGEATEPAAETGLNVDHLRMTEALLFAAAEPLSEEALKSSLPEGADVAACIAELQKLYEKRGVTLVCVADKWQFRTAPDLAFLLRKEKPEQKRLSRAAIETLAIIAYHQPVTRAEIEEIRGVALSKGTLDTLMEVGWVKIRGRKRTPGRPVTYGTTEAFLVQFGLENVSHLPGMEELKAAGFLEAMPPAGMEIPSPSDQLGPDEDPYDGEEITELATGGADPFMPGSSAE